MATIMASDARAVRPISAAEQAIRRDLAACYRLVALLGWDDLVATHISARLPDEEAFLLNPFGMLFEEVTASSLVKVDADGTILDPSPYAVNKAGFVIHSAIHQARHDAACVIHLHTRTGVAVSTLEEGLLPLNQTAMLISNDIAFHDYEGVATNLEERERLARDLGDKTLMLLRNHGTLALGPTIADAFTSIYFLEWACAVQVNTLGMGRPLHAAHPDAIASVAAARKPGPSALASDLVWPAMLRKVDRLSPGYDQ
jgi:ribulose-5-phosphate 4-epimerase/fuculose-1-phosphate aldolase